MLFSCSMPSGDENALPELAGVKGREEEMRAFCLQDASQAVEGVEE